METTQKALYVGAGTDTTPITSLKHINEFIFIDCQPFSEFGVLVHKCDPRWCNEVCIGYSRPRFIKEIVNKMKKIGMNYKKISDNELKFTNEIQTVTYFVNTSIPEHIDRISVRIKDFDNLIVMGHDPDSIVLKYTNKNLTLWGNTETVYSKCYDDIGECKNNLCFRMNREKSIRNRFLHFNLIDGRISSYYKLRPLITSFDNWSKFVSHSSALKYKYEKTDY